MAMSSGSLGDAIFLNGSADGFSTDLAACGKAEYRSPSASEVQGLLPVRGQ